MDFKLIALYIWGIAGIIMFFMGSITNGILCFVIVSVIIVSMDLEELKLINTKDEK